MAITCVIPTILSFVYLRETPRFLMMNGDYERAFSELAFIMESNGCTGSEMLSPQNRQRMVQWAEKLTAQTRQARFSELFRGKYRIITPLLCTCWFVTNLIMYGIIFYVPLTMVEVKMGTPDQDFAALLIMSLSMVPAVIISAYSVDIKGIGRRYSLLLAYIATGLLMLLISYQKTLNFIFLISLCKFMVRLQFTYIYMYTAEIFGTKIRVTGTGLCSAVSRLSGIILPFLSIPLTKNHPFLPYFIFGIFSLLAAVACYFMPYDTLGEPLDIVE